MTVSEDGLRVWLITGASSGLGRALAEALLDHGERVVATARDPQLPGDLADRYPGQAVAARLDVTDPDEARVAVDEGLSAFDRIDVVVNNAGYGLFGALEELPGEELRREFETKEHPRQAQPPPAGPGHLGEGQRLDSGTSLSTPRLTATRVRQPCVTALRR